MSTRKKYSSLNPKTWFSKSKPLKSESSSAPARSEQNAEAGSDPMLTDGAMLHRCEHCQDLVLEFGQSDDDIRRIVQSLVDDESLRKEYTALALAWKNDFHDERKAAVLGFNMDQIHLAKSENCKVFECMTPDHDGQREKYTLFGVKFSEAESNLSVSNITEGVENLLDDLPVYVSEGKFSTISHKCSESR